jgi:glycosyltransferase involved in cell wall biosynthesis
MRISAFFQHMPPYSGAAALRGHSIINGLVSLKRAGEGAISVYTTTPNPLPIPGALVQPLNVPEVENAEGLVSRIVGEIRMGRAAAHAMFSSGRCEFAVISTPAYLAALVIAARARKLRIPYVVELRDVYPQVYAEAGLLRHGSMLYQFFEDRSRQLYEGAQLVLAATKGLAREVSQAAPCAQVACVYNGFPSALRTRSFIKHERFTLCFHGTMGFFQDIETLIALAARLAAHNVDVVVIGYGRKENLLQRARLPNLRFLGRLPFENTIAEIERCHLGLCLRLDDGISKDAFPVKVWEYIGLGMPSIVTPPCEAGDFLEAYGCGVQLPAGDIDALTRQVLELKNKPELLEALSQQCARAAEAYTREQTGLAAARLVDQAWRRVGNARHPDDLHRPGDLAAPR